MPPVILRLLDFLRKRKSRKKKKKGLSHSSDRGSYRIPITAANFPPPYPTTTTTKQLLLVATKQ